MRDHPTGEPAVEPATGLDQREAEAIVTDAARRYFAGCRARIDPFIDANYAFAASARLHGHAIGWDLLRAPANVALALPQVLLKLGAAGARRLKLGEEYRVAARNAALKAELDRLLGPPPESPPAVAAA